MEERPSFVAGERKQIPRRAEEREHVTMRNRDERSVRADHRNDVRGVVRFEWRQGRCGAVRACTRIDEPHLALAERVGRRGATDAHRAAGGGQHALGALRVLVGIDRHAGRSREHDRDGGDDRVDRTIEEQRHVRPTPNARRGKHVREPNDFVLELSIRERSLRVLECTRLGLGARSCEYGSADRLGLEHAAARSAR
jgi:hypothetical protein